MKIKLMEVSEKLRALASVQEKTLPSKLSFALSYNVEKLEQEAKRFEKAAEELRDRYASKDDGGKPIYETFRENGFEYKKAVFTRENERAFTEELEELRNEEVEIEVRKVEQTLIERCEEVERYDIPTPREIKALSFMLQ